MSLDQTVLPGTTILPLLVILLTGLVPSTKSGENSLSKQVHLSIPPSHTALSGDLHVQLTYSIRYPAGVQLRLSRLDTSTAHVLYTVPALRDARSLSNATIIRIPCGYFSRGGEYYVELIRPNNSTALDEDVDDNDKVSRGLDVRWPMPRLSLTPEHVQTYPESPVTAILEFPEVMCPPVSDSAPSAIPEFWLELHYCGHSLLTCDNNNNQTHTQQVLYSEQIRGFPGKRMLILRCELFGLAGHYSLVLRPTTPMPSLSNTAAYVKADWSEQFVFNVHARSIMPCDPHSGGVTVLFQYPSCILASGDRVRLYARLRADVASLAPPTSMEYVAEQKVVRGQHSLHFECDLFTERYVEYCFVYVSQAITGAVADVRMDCVPTLPVSESESGGWGKWSPWTPCSTSCPGGTRNRYRFCDSPPPRYGAKFCEGAAVETEKCGSSKLAATDWECIYGSGVASGDISPADRPEILAEVGPGCRCGCVIHLGQQKPRRLLATSSQSCPGRTFWLIQADENYSVRFKVDHFRLPCGSQWLKVRDGNSLSATLLAQLAGTPETAPAAVQSTGPYLLLEFFSDELMAGGEACGGGFLAHAQQIKLHSRNGSLLAVSAVASVPVAQGVGLVSALPGAAMRLTAVHIVALLCVSVVLVATLLLAAQYILRYRKYHIAEDMDSLADLAESNVSIALRTRASSSATLLSEVISLTRLRPTGRNRHTRLRESMDCDAEHEGVEECANDDSGIVQLEEGSDGSTTTLTPQDQPTAPVTTISESLTEEASASAASISPTSPNVSERSEDRESISPVPGLTKQVPRHRCLSNVTLTNVRAQLRARSDPGCYSPATSIISTATIRSTNPKECKEKRNRERLLQGPGSEFSLAGPDTDLELDYYDYNVGNAGAVPGSYLGMDPQYLVWIPPLDETGEILQNLEKYPFEYEDIRPKQFIDPGSNQESPEEEMLIPKRRRSISEGVSKRSPVVFHKKVSPLIGENSSTDLKNSIKCVPVHDVSLLNENLSLELGKVKIVDGKCAIPLHEFPRRLGIHSPAKVHKPSEKETKCEKSPSVKSFHLDDIKFADDECDEFDLENDTAKTPSTYHDSNISTSNKS